GGSGAASGFPSGLYGGAACPAVRWEQRVENHRASWGRAHPEIRTVCEAAMNLVRLLKERAAEHPERVALVDSSGGRDRALTFAELDRRVAAGADFLNGLGLERGRTVLVFQPVSLELY